MFGAHITLSAPVLNMYKGNASNSCILTGEGTGLDDDREHWGYYKGVVLGRTLW
jgi:hypothetical protein